MTLTQLRLLDNISGVKFNASFLYQNDDYEQPPGPWTPHNYNHTRQQWARPTGAIGFFFPDFFLLFECFRLCIAHSRLINSNVNTCPWPLLPLSSPRRTINIYWNRNCKWPSTPHTWMNVAREMSPICHFMGFLLHLTQGPRHNLDTTTNTSDNGWQIQFAMDMFF